MQSHIDDDATAASYTPSRPAGHTAAVAFADGFPPLDRDVTLGAGCRPLALNRHRTVSIQASAGVCLVTTESILAMSFCENNKLLVKL